MFTCIPCFPAKCTCHNTSWTAATEPSIEDRREEIELRRLIGELSDAEAATALEALAA